MSGNFDLVKKLGGTIADAVGVKLRTEVIFLHPDQVSPDPDQPRQEFDAEGLNRLAVSLRKYGQLQPILVRKERSGYVLVSGERRWRAAKIAGIANVQALLCKGGDVRSIQLVENLLREDLKPIEQARAYQAIMKKEGWSARELARQLSIEHSGITRALALLRLSAPIQKKVDAGQIPQTTAYEITKQPKAEQASLARKAAAGVIKGDDLRRAPVADAPVFVPALTLGASTVETSWTYQAGRVQIKATGHRSREEMATALEKAAAAARAGKPSLKGGI